VQKKKVQILLSILLIVPCITAAQNNTFEIFQTGNSEIPSNNITAVTQDKSGSYWFGFGNDGDGNTGALAKFNGTGWQIIDTGLINFENSYITDIEADDLNNIYIATFGGGVIKYDGTKFTLFDTTNSDIPANDILCIAVENTDKIWFGSYWEGLIKLEAGE